MINKELAVTDQNPPREAATDAARGYLSGIARALAAKPFIPHPLFTQGHAQTLAGFAWPRRFALRAHRFDQPRLFEIAPDVKLLAHCRWQAPERADCPTLILVHGLEGSSASVYMLGTADKAFRAGYNVVRLNLRNCGGTEHLTPTLYNSGLSGDIHAVVKELIERDQLRSIFLVGFSMSGNIVLKFAGEAGSRAPRELSGVCAVSPSIDLRACAKAIEEGGNWLYEQTFMRSLRRRIRTKQRLYPEIYDTTDLHLLRTIREFDDRYTAVDGGYLNVDDYYERASSLPLIRHIHVPTLIIHAQDDPFIPFESFRDPQLRDNPFVLLLSPANGGHVGFISNSREGEGRFWAENRVVEFCQLAGKLAEG